MRELEILHLPHSREISYAIYGSPMPKTTVFYFHSFPSSRKEGKLWHTAASKLHIRLIAPDRPGAGLSSSQSNRTLLDWPKDVLALADHLKIEHFYVMGLNGGGPYALACVKGLPKERLAGVTVVSGLYPLSFGTAGMPFTSRLMLWAAPWMPGFLGTIMDQSMGKAARDHDTKVFRKHYLKEIENRPEVDRTALKNEKNMGAFIEATREGLRQSAHEWALETRLHGSAWGFELHELDVGDLGVPLHLWHGTKDMNSPPAMVIKAKEIMPGAKLNMKEGEGHISCALRNQETILTDLIGVWENS